MPMYEYQCEANGHRFERIQKFSDPPIATCPTCGSAVRKLLSSPAIQFKGSGFYINDYARKGGSGSSGGESRGKASSSDKDSKSDGGSDSSSSSGTSTSDGAKSDTSTKSESSTSDTSKKD